MKARLLVLSLTVAAVLAGCGSDDAGPLEDDSDKRALALECLTEEKGVEARLDGDDWIVLDGDADGARIRFFLTAGEAEAEQFEGRGEGAEQIGSTLLFVKPQIRPRSDEVLEDVEKCLAEVG